MGALKTPTNRLHWKAMSIHSFHLAKTSIATVAQALLRPPTPHRTPGLRQAECMTVMELGSPILSPARMQIRHLAVFAAWDDERSIESFLSDTQLGRTLSTGWHVRLELIRRWGRVSEFDEAPSRDDNDPAAPVVAVTLARLKLPQVPRFIRWGKPVEKLVRDHPGATLALAAMRPPRTVCTFSIWGSRHDMTDMVHGRGDIPDPARHAKAMVERKRKHFHHEFTTLRFAPLLEQGEWQGRRNIVPT